MFTNNNIILMQNGKEIRLTKVQELPLGLKLDIKGKQNTIIIGENCKFSGSLIAISNNKSTVKIGNQCTMVNLVLSINAGENQNLDIGNNCTFFGGMIVLRDSSVIKIGEECLFAKGLSMWATDGHTIYDLTTEEVINTTPEKLEIGKHCWIGGDVHILKNGSLADETIVGISSVVTKTFTETNTVIGGFPARLIRRNVGWNRHTIPNWLALKQSSK